MADSALPKVLIVDDEKDIRAGLRNMLEQLDELDISEVADGQSALDAMAKTQFDLLLLDINLPVVAGDVVLTLIAYDETYNRPGLITLMSAASNLDLVRTRPVAVIVDSFLGKPFRYEDLQKIVADIAIDGMLGGLVD